MNNRIQELGVKLSATEREEPDRLAKQFKKENTPGPPGILNRCSIWSAAKYLSQEQMEYFIAASGVQAPSIYSFVMDTMADRYHLLTNSLGTQSHAAAAQAMISMIDEEDFKNAVAALEQRAKLNPDALLKDIADAAWEVHKKHMR